MAKRRSPASRSARDFSRNPRVPPSPKELALAVGLTDDSRGCRFDVPQDEDEAMHVLSDCLASLDAVHEVVVLSQFCVQYLPDLVKSFLSPKFSYPAPIGNTDRLSGSDCRLLIHLHPNQYFMKYFLSSHPSSRRSGEVTRLLMERFQERLPIYFGAMAIGHAKGPSIAKYVLELCDTLLLLLTLHPWQPWAAPIPLETRSTLAASLDEYVELDPTAYELVTNIQSALVRRDFYWLNGMGRRLDSMRSLYNCCWENCRVFKQDNLYLCSRPWHIAVGRTSVLTGTIRTFPIRMLVIQPLGENQFGGAHARYASITSLSTAGGWQLPDNLGRPDRKGDGRGSDRDTLL